MKWTQGTGRHSRRQCMPRRRGDDTPVPRTRRFDGQSDAVHSRRANTHATLVAHRADGVVGVLVAGQSDVERSAPPTATDSRMSAPPMATHSRVFGRLPPFQLSSGRYWKRRSHFSAMFETLGACQPAEGGVAGCHALCEQTLACTSWTFAPPSCRHPPDLSRLAPFYASNGHCCLHQHLRPAPSRNTSCALSAESGTPCRWGCRMPWPLASLLDNLPPEQIDAQRRRYHGHTVSAASFPWVAVRCQLSIPTALRPLLRLSAASLAMLTVLGSRPVAADPAAHRA